MEFEKLDFPSKEKEGKVKKIFSEKIIAFALVFVVFIITFYFYQRGKVSFLSRKEKAVINETFEVQIPISDKEYKLSYQNKANSSFEIASFEESESWSGDGVLDFSTFYEGGSSLFLTSLDGRKTVVGLKKGFDIKEMINFKFFFYLASEPSDLEELNLVFVGAGKEYKFPIRSLDKGWNLLVLPKEKFSIHTVGNETEGREGMGTNIQEVVIELVSRPKTRSSVNLDAIWAEKEKDYLNDWNVDSDNFLSIKASGGLLAIGLDGRRATLKKGSVKDGTFQMKFTPMKNGELALFLRGDYKSGYGYYLVMGGVDTNSWRVEKHGSFEGKTETLVLREGKINNFKMEKGQAYWVKSEMKGSKIIFYFSVNGKDFTKLGEVDDNSFSSGGIGIAAAVDTMFSIDDLQFFQ